MMPGEQPTGARLDRAKELLFEAEQMEPAVAAAWVREAAADDPSLRDYVLHLLADASTVASPFSRIRGAAADYVRSEQPDRIGRYTILRTLGQGGMGTVYLAEQTEPVQRRVALKLVKLGMDSEAIVRRFGQERQALALMEHDGIAKVHDCGTSERGQPFFVMELVEGEPIALFCDRRRLPLRQRLQVLQMVCDAVQHAHHKGVVHRDLKPSNVLVAEVDGRMRVKIIDFGLAKAMDHKLGAASLLTDPGQILGTVEYMAPEQADPANADVDTRADVYSLGVMLYELLVGSLPFGDTELRKAGMLELQRVLQTVEPPRPSVRLAALPVEVRARTAADRGLSVAALHKALARDLDWVVGKAMEKDRDRRYESAAALAVDVQRFLDHEPLAAGPPSAGYRLRKFVRRNRGRVAGVTAVVLTAVVGGVVATSFALSSQRLAAEKSAKVREFDLLAGVVVHARAVEAEKSLHPPWPDRIAAMERWLEHDVGRLLAMRPEIERTLRDMRARALPRSEQAVAADRRAHPSWPEYERQRKVVESMRAANAVRAGAVLDVPEVPTTMAGLDARTLRQLAIERTSPDMTQRGIVGEERLGLALARLAVARASGVRAESAAREALAWALFVNGCHDDAIVCMDAAMALEGGVDRSAREGLAAAIANVDDVLAGYERSLAALQAVVDERRTYDFELESDRFLHDALDRLQGDMARLEATQKVEVERRVVWARTVGSLTRAHPRARHSWSEVRAAIRSADGVVASERYRGSDLELSERAVMGLVPIGMNPVTRLWEFYDLHSAWDGRRDPATLPIPQHESDGSIDIGDDTGIVFVLLPAGQVTMGSQSDDPAAPNYDPDAGWYMKPVNDVRLSAFLLGRHEVTQGQWARLWHRDDASGRPSKYKAGTRVTKLDQPVTFAHPVEQIDWRTAKDLLEHHGMALPTEAQWEYAARAGTASLWSCAPEDLPRCVNLADETARLGGADWPGFEPWSDGHAIAAPVDTLRPNPWGFYHVHGNVSEWCLDTMGSYAWSVRPGDGLRLASTLTDHISRGGNFASRATYTRTAMRNQLPAAFRADFVGVRAARAVD
jgi:formylglycine-generating enzyme required for sulfatase activity/tRNA A-37 threonylcarbamoyl transferase component Bud32